MSLFSLFLAAPCSFETYFPKLEAIVLFGEPIRWETSLQLLIDALLTSGMPAVPPKSIPYPHVPILACNMDLQWMGEALMPRFGHGAFLLCLENLYKKVTDRELIYTALVGKPSEITYRHSEHVLQEQAQLLQCTVRINILNGLIRLDIFLKMNVFVFVTEATEEHLYYW
jgi:HAD superfamily hydrolase (TIGR01456 family)